ncbi:MAG: hypothetical protein A2015_05435 [Spirochaetes bacterium GWF1_31_7]|nr:MAG: hypothetical protein A2Y30_04775 [Spirochaetes bacterium GWE1_32_154]OHD47806.1 MAG: hypothetical protein A2Y29_09495 [Spirochaetes bacterium GWE2_31_10]OHD52534.1 MAG: hypothetical protein A2015_05435 [Spirochaetes bacterium GWF1_31_7]HBD93409.1 hypothetical protein [Spirochaetia bacterium]HBI36283.1 hypothetical protein [Spirochaetia bacterium]
MKKLFIVILSLCVVMAIYSQDISDDLLGDFGSSSIDDSTVQSTQTGFNTNAFELTLQGNSVFQVNAPVDPDNLNFSGYAKSPNFSNQVGLVINYADLKLVSLWDIDLVLNQSGDIASYINATPGENALYWSPWKFKIGAGFQIYSWGKADGLNPTDNINPRDYRMGVDSEKLSVLSASVNFYPVNWFSMEAVYVPYYQQSLYPKDFIKELQSIDGFRKESIRTELTNAELLTRLITPPDNNDDDGEKALTMMYLSTINTNQRKTISYDYNKYDFTTPIAGGKLNFNTSVIDFSFSYLYDYDKFPTPEITLVKEDLAQLLILQNPATFALMLPIINGFSKNIYSIDSIQLQYRRIHRIGFDIKKVFNNGVGLWLEAGYSMTDDYDNTSYKIRNDKLEWTLGTDFNFGPDNSFYANIQYSGNWNVGFDDTFYNDYADGKPDVNKIGDEGYMEEFYYRAITNSLSSQYAGLNQGLIVNMKFPFHNDMFAPELTAGYMVPLLYNYNWETKYGSAIIKPSFKIMPFDSFYITIGANLLYSWHKVGEEISLDRETDQFGVFTADNKIFLEVEYKWAFTVTK